MTASSLSPPSSQIARQAAAAPGLPRAWSTPRKLKVYRGVVWALVGLLFVLGESTLSQSRRAFKTIGKDTVPSIIAAQEIGYALADLDANVANSLLGNAQHRQAANLGIEKQRVKVTDSLVDAAENITYGDAEKGPIQRMMRDLGLYLERESEARLRFDLGDATAARAAYWDATDMLHKRMLVEATNLDAANKVQLDAAYRDGGQETAGAEHIAIVLGSLLGAALLGLQLFLFRRTRRILNAPLLGATLATVIFAGFLASRFITARESLRVAKEDAFDSIHSLVKARALAYDANGDESRFLLDTGATRKFDLAYRDKVATLTTTPTDRAPTPAIIEARKRAAKGGVKRETGLFWDELDNIMFDGELKAATAMVQAYRDYALIDARIRKLWAAGQTADAIELCIGDKPDESNAAFDRFDSALQSTLDINRAAFDREIDRTGQSLRVAELVSIGLSILVALLTWLGLRPRLREYSA